MLPLVRRCWMMPFARCVAGLGERHVGVKTFSCGIMGMIFVQLFPVGMIKMYLMVIAMGLLYRQKLGFLGPRKFFGFFYPHITGTAPPSVAVHTMAWGCFTVRTGVVCHIYFMSVKKFLLPMLIRLQKHHIHR